MANCQRQNDEVHGGEELPANRRVTFEEQGQETTLDLCPVCYHWSVKRDASLKITNVEPIDE